MLNIDTSIHRVIGLGYQPTPNVGKPLTPLGIIVHDTGALNAEGSINWLCNPKSGVSAHFVVARDGKITQLAPCNRQTWHAGKSSWRGRANVNGFAVGIEIANPGKLTPMTGGYRNDLGVEVTGALAAQVGKATTKEHGSGYWLAYSPEQIGAVTDLCKELRIAYPDIAFVAPHWEISPGRKIDTNPLFPLTELRNKLFGVFAGPRVVVSEIETVQRRLVELGYHEVGEVDGLFGEKTRGALLAFQADNFLQHTGVIDDRTKAALETAKPRAVPITRLFAGEEAVALRPAVRRSRIAQRLVTWIFGGAGALGTANETGLLDKAEHISGLGQRFMALVSPWTDSIGTLLAIVRPAWPLVVLIIVVLIVRELRSIRKAEVDAYRSGEIT